MAKKIKEAQPPTLWIKSINGTVAEVTRTHQTNFRGQRLYRLRYEDDVRGSRTWTIEDLMEHGKRWLKAKPVGWGK
jgi:hypothetical protein